MFLCVFGQVQTERVQVILDEGGARRSRGDAAANAAAAGEAHSAAAALSGSEAAALIKIGVRVLRGPDWKWGDQVLTINYIKSNLIKIKNYIKSNQLNLIKSK